MSFRPDCKNTVEVPSFTLCTALSALPFVSDLRGVDVQWFRWSEKWFLVHVKKLQKPPSRGTQSQTLLAEWRIIPYSTETHWRIQNSRTNLEVLQERRIDDSWNIDGSRDLSDPWTGFKQFTLLEEKPPDGYMWSGERLTKLQVTTRPDQFMARALEKMGTNAKLKERSKWSNEKLNSIMPEDYEEFILLTLRKRNSKRPFRMRARNWKHRWLQPCLARK